MGIDEAASTERYGIDSIVILEGLEPIRLRPGMYVGDINDGSGLHNLVAGLIDRILDEYVERRCFHVTVTLHASGAVTVADDGPGLGLQPGERPSGSSVPWVELIFTTLFIGSKDCALPSANALSEYLVVDVERDGALHRQEFRRGAVASPLERIGPSSRTGTSITFRPDPQIFATTRFDARRIGDLLRELTFLNPGIRAELHDVRGRPAREVFFSRGITDWVARLTEGVAVFPSGSPLRCREVVPGVSVDAALRWTDSPGTRVLAYANRRAVPKGAHVAGLFDALDGLGAPRRGLVAVVDVRPPPAVEFEFKGSCRERLAGEEVRAGVRDVVSRGLREALRRAPPAPAWWAGARER